MPRTFDAYGEWHQGNLSACVTAHTDLLSPLVDENVRSLVERLHEAPVFPMIANVLMEQVAEEFARWLVHYIGESDPSIDLASLIRQIMARTHTTFKIDLLLTDDLVQRKIHGQRNNSGLNTADPKFN